MSLFVASMTTLGMGFHIEPFKTELPTKLQIARQKNHPEGWLTNGRFARIEWLTQQEAAWPRRRFFGPAQAGLFFLVADGIGCHLGAQRKFAYRKHGLPSVIFIS